MAPGGRITEDVVRDEVTRLERTWRKADHLDGDDGIEALIGREQIEGLDLFDRLQLAAVGRVCRTSSSLSEAGRRMFAASRSKKAAPNDADRLRKYLVRFGLSWSTIVDRP